MFRNGQSFFDRYGGGLTSDLRQKLRDVEEQDIREAIETFDRAIAEAGLQDRAEFLTPERVGKVLPSEMARHYDMVVTGFHTDHPNEEHLAASPGMIALKSGRPVLVVPQSYDSPGLADHALLAWDGKRSAARALGDAMGILEGKRQVTVLTVGSAEPKPSPDGGILRHLERHGVAARHVHRFGKGKSVAAEIEDVAEELGAKLIVMGAFEHSKFSQDLFGGVTHEVLKSARVPVFMSH
jgi:nucleotide-binding universal stress UspA family protein